jgi:hypothetical protein
VFVHVHVGGLAVVVLVRVDDSVVVGMLVNVPVRTVTTHQRANDEERAERDQ